MRQIRQSHQHIGPGSLDGALTAEFSQHSSICASPSSPRLTYLHHPLRPWVYLLTRLFAESDSIPPLLHQHHHLPSTQTPPTPAPLPPLPIPSIIFLRDIRSEVQHFPLPALLPLSRRFLISPLTSSFSLPLSYPRVLLFFCSSLPIASSPQGISVWYRVVLESFLKSASSLRSESVWICVVCIFSVFVCAAAPVLCSRFTLCVCCCVACVRVGCKGEVGTVLSLILSVPPWHLGSTNFIPV